MNTLSSLLNFIGNNLKSINDNLEFINDNLGVYAVGTNEVNLGAVNTFTASKNGWAVIGTVTGQTAPSQPPVIRVATNGQTIVEYTGATLSQSANYVSLPVKKGHSYTISPYRTTINFVKIYS